MTAAPSPGDSFVYYLDTSFAETIRRHRSRPQADQFTPSQMRGWFKDNDRLGVPGETVIGETSTVAGTVDQILTHSGLRNAPPTTYCPTGCPRCQDEANRPAN